MVKCLTQEHNMLVTAGFEPATFGLRVNSFIHCATHAHIYAYNITKLGFICEIIVSSLISSAIGTLGCQHLPKKCELVRVGQT